MVCCAFSTSMNANLIAGASRTKAAFFGISRSSASTHTFVRSRTNCSRSTVVRQDPPANDVVASLRKMGTRYVVVDSDQPTLPNAVGPTEVYCGAGVVAFAVW